MQNVNIELKLTSDFSPEQIKEIFKGLSIGELKDATLKLYQVTPEQLNSKTSVSRETPETPVSRETDETPVSRETDETPVSRETDETPVSRETDETPVSRETPEEPVSRETPEEPVSRETSKALQKRFKRNASSLDNIDESAIERELRAWFKCSGIPDNWEWRSANGKASPNFKPSEVKPFLKLPQKASPVYKACRKALLKWLQSNQWTMPKTSLMWSVRSIFEKQFEWPKGSAKNGKTWQEILENGQK